MTQEKIDSIRERMCEECCAFSTLSQLVKDEVCNACPLNELEASAEPEIIRCKDCKYWHREIHNDIEYFNFSSCDLNHYGDGHNFYCADAERRTDE